MQKSHFAPKTVTSIASLFMGVEGRGRWPSFILLFMKSLLWLEPLEFNRETAYVCLLLGSIDGGRGRN